MKHIEFTPSLPLATWESLYNDPHLSDAYRAHHKDPNVLANDFSKRVKALCKQNMLPSPKKIILAPELKSCLKIPDSGELQIHPLTFIASKLDKNLMTEKQQALYKQIENYISEADKREIFFPNFQIPLKAAEREELIKDLNDYAYIMPSNELDECIVKLLTFYKTHRIHQITPTLSKRITILASAILSSLSALTVSQVASGPMRWPMIGVSGLVVAGISYKGLRKKIEKSLTDFSQSIIQKDLATLLFKPWHESSEGDKAIQAKRILELPEGQPPTFPMR